MTIYTQVNTGAADDDGTGDTVRAAFEKVNANFALQDVAITMDESAAQANPGAAKGRLWVKDTAPTTLIFTDDTGVETVLGSGGGGGVPGGADTQLQFNDGGVFAGNPFLTVDTEGVSGQHPTLILDGTQGNHRYPTLLMNYDANDFASIEFEEEGVIRGHIRYYASSGGLDNLVIRNQFGSGEGRITLTSVNVTTLSSIEEGISMERGLRIKEQVAPLFADTVAYGQLWVRNDAPNTLMFTDDVGTDTELTGEVATREKSLNQPGELITIISTLRWYPTRDITLINITANVGVAATGANIVLDVKKNGVTILASNITILATAFTAAPVVPTDTTLLTTDYLTVDVVQIGLSLPGEDLVVNCKYQ